MHLVWYTSIFWPREFRRHLLSLQCARFFATDVLPPNCLKGLERRTGSSTSELATWNLKLFWLVVYIYTRDVKFSNSGSVSDYWCYGLSGFSCRGALPKRRLYRESVSASFRTRLQNFEHTLLFPKVCVDRRKRLIFENEAAIRNSVLQFPMI